MTGRANAILVGDVGGTNTRLARAAAEGGGYRIDDVEVYPSTGSTGLLPILERYLDERPGAIGAASFGLPGPVHEFRVRTTNIPWEVDGARLERALGVKVTLSNDLEAAAHGVLVLAPEHAVTLQKGREEESHRAVIAAGTGLGQALIVRHGATWIPCASEGGHTDFAPRNEEEIELWRFLADRYGHVSYERIASGPGLVDLHAFYAARLGETLPPWSGDEDRAAAVARGAADGRPACVAAIERFVAVLAAEAGNLALKIMARGGVYLAGGIAPKLLDWLRGEPFLDAFRSKGRYRELMETFPVRVVTDPHVALRGAAHAADDRASG